MLLDLLGTQTPVTFTGEMLPLKQSSLWRFVVVQLVDVIHDFARLDEVTRTHAVADQLSGLTHLGFTVKEVIEHFEVGGTGVGGRALVVGVVGGDVPRLAPDAVGVPELRSAELHRVNRQLLK